MFDLKRVTTGLDRAGSARLAFRRRAFIDHVVLPATETANGVPVWLTCAAGLAASGRRGRELVGRALLSTAVASTLADQVIKRLVGRSRPAWSWARRTPHRTSGSFPSGHSATAAAFATTALVEWPAVGAPLVVLAGAVCYARIYSRQHYVLDVAGGVVLGATVAGVIHVIGRHREPKPADPAQPPGRMSSSARRRNTSPSVASGP